MGLSPVEHFHMCSETFHEFHMVSVREEIWYPGRVLQNDLSCNQLTSARTCAEFQYVCLSLFNDIEE